MFICWVLFVLDLFSFASIKTILMLSCCNSDGFDLSLLMIDLIGKLRTRCSTNSSNQITKFIASYTPIISATVELVKLTFYLFDSENTTSVPNVSIAPVWLRISLCKLNDALMLQSSVPDPSHSIINSKCTVLQRYRITLASLNNCLPFILYLWSTSKQPLPIYLVELASLQTIIVPSYCDIHQPLLYSIWGNSCKQ